MKFEDVSVAARTFVVMLLAGVFAWIVVPFALVTFPVVSIVRRLVLADESSDIWVGPLTNVKWAMGWVYFILGSGMGLRSEMNLRRPDVGMAKESSIFDLKDIFV